jgi:uncharacterized protein
MASFQQPVSQAGQAASLREEDDVPAFQGGSSRSILGALLFLCVVAAAAAAQAAVVRYGLPSRPGRLAVPVAGSFAGSTILAIAVAAGTAALAWKERRSFASYGLLSKHPLRNLTGGALSGIALLSAVVLLLHQLDLVVFRGQVLFGAAAEWKLAARSAAFFSLGAFAEEALVRGYLQYTLTRALAPVFRRFDRSRSGVAAAFWVAALLLSTLFALLLQQYTGKSHLVLLNTFLFGLLMAFSLWRTGSLWWALGYHAAWDWAQSFLWGVPNSGVRAPDHLFLTEATGSALRSGGSIGPEGSAYTAGALAAGLAILMLLHRSRVYPDLWDVNSGDAV